MARLEWDKVGERFFETGIDRGVLFTVEGIAVPWNGLTQISENSSSEVQPYWQDGVKYFEQYSPGVYSAKLSAFTYPDVLDELTGAVSYAPGVHVHDQTARAFHLSYRTGVGNDLDAEVGYKLHVIYNVLAIPSYDISTVGETTEPAQMTWDLSATPSSVAGIRPTAHISLQSRWTNPATLETIEGLLYGNDAINPALPSMANLLTLVTGG
jgi:hypothetical protein